VTVERSGEWMLWTLVALCIILGGWFTFFIFWRRRKKQEEKFPDKKNWM
jgi:cytochrome c-type biogenesis protein CcmH/NrfF